jgi:pyruvate/2-oxoglutarate dehydrogenase complex dihydrolipoamide acyltransferase (E2) component
MSQISPPIRIVLVAAVAFLAAWMLFLRPKTEEIPPPAPAATAPAKQPGTTAQSAAGKAVQAAENAKATAESAAKARAGETAAPTAPATKAPASQPAAKVAATKLDVDPAALNTLPSGVRKALEARKIVVLGFFNRAALDDRLTKKQLEKVHRFHGRVYVHAAALNAVQRYQVITRGADVSQTPSIVVIDRDMKAQLLTGYVDHVRVEQAIVDAMRRSDMPVVKSPYLRKVNALCGTYTSQLAVALEPGVHGGGMTAQLRANARRMDRFAGRLAALKAPKGYRSFKVQWVSDLKLASQADHALLAALKGKSAQGVSAFLEKYEKPLTAAGKRIDKSSRQHDMLACFYG